MEIITNKVPRFTIEAHELTDKEREEFDWIDWDKVDAGEDSHSFFRYKKQLYCLTEFIAVFSTPGWDGISEHSAFNGILVRLIDAGERVIVGRYYS